MSFKGLQIADTAFLAASASPIGPTSPDEIAGLVRWYKADTFALADGTAIGGTGNEWLDQSPTAPNNATQGNAGQRPVFRTNVFGSQPAVQFDAGLTQFLLMPGIVLAGDFTVIGIVKVSAESVFLGEAFGGFKTLIYRSAVNVVAFRDGLSDIISDAFSEVQTNVRMITWRRSSDQISFRESNTARGAETSASGVVSFTYDAIGINAGGGGLASGHYGEICVYNQHISDANIDSLYSAYFKPKFSLA